MDVFMTYIVPVLIGLGLAAVLAFALAFLGEKMKVQRDEKIDLIRSHLSGANCGGCGYPGCDAFAEAVFKGEADVSRCNPTSSEGKAAIADLLGVKLQAEEPKKAVVHCNGGTACANKSEYLGYSDCVNAMLIGGGPKACAYGCLGYGNCVKVCPVEAVSIKENKVSVVDRKVCIACGACVRECPKNIIGMIPESAKIFVACSGKCKGKAVMDACQNGCIACGLCEKVCPTGAIKLNQNIAVIDYSKCTACGACVEKCPRNCIHTLK